MTPVSPTEPPVQEHAQVPPTRQELAQNFVDSAFKKLEALPNFVPQSGQIHLAKRIAVCYVEGRSLAAEAPTGTGKTLAYLVGALAAAHTSAQPIVVATATKALQAQVMANDLPKLAEVGLVDLSKVALAKGKSNYICTRDAQGLVDVANIAMDDPDMFAQYDPSDLAESDRVQAMLNAYAAGLWDGDFDAYGGKEVSRKRTIAVSSDSCTGKKCENYSSCAYFAAKNRINGSNLIVSNHDLVLLDLLLTAEDGGEPTISVSNYLLVVDEAHHLPDKAMELGSTSANITHLLTSLPHVAAFSKKLTDAAALHRQVSGRGVSLDHLDRRKAMKAVFELESVLNDLDIDEETQTLRFKKGVLPDSITAAVQVAYTDLLELYNAISESTTALKSMPPDMPVHLKDAANDAIRRVGELQRTLKEACSCLSGFLKPWSADAPSAKWVFRGERSLSLHTAPLEAAPVLNQILWNSKRAKAALVSATLRDVTGFNRFGAKVGLPRGKSSTLALPYTFDYSQSTLYVPAMKHTPKQGERRQFIEELKRAIPSTIDASEGTLLLFPSWQMMKEVMPAIQAQFGEHMVRIQGQLPVKQLIAQHCADIDAGKGGILAGVATMAEGLDLPGAYCSHVGIMTIPFAVPADPVEMEIQDLLGKRYFGDRSLPDATTKLIQMVGRLLRRSSDRGRVTLYDRRLVTTDYGRRILEALPPFRRIVEPSAAK